MKKIKLIYNPNSGDKSFPQELDSCIGALQSGGYEVHPFRTQKYGDIQEHIAQIASEGIKYNAFAVSGGDGTINTTINSIMNNRLNNVPIGLIPSGTANDFGSFLNLSHDPEECCRLITRGRTINVDLGKANDTYFINVCAGGLFSNAGQRIDKVFKDALGKTAYYLQAASDLHGFKPIPMRITNSKTTIKDNINLFLVLNSSGTGGIENLSPRASINDGKLDFVGIKGLTLQNIPELTKLIVRFYKGDYLEDENVIFFRDNYIKIENLAEDGRMSQTDCDGEFGPQMPVEIINVHNAIKIFI